jgi:hypothetical protein
VQKYLYDTNRWMLKKTSGGPKRLALGKFYIVDEKTMEVIQKDVDLKAIAEKAGTALPDYVL